MMTYFLPPSLNWKKRFLKKSANEFLFLTIQEMFNGYIKNRIDGYILINLKEDWRYKIKFSIKALSID